VIADREKSAFRAVASNKGTFICTGPWAWSRHPNYLGEIVLWGGVFLCAISGVSKATEADASAGYFGWIYAAPVTLFHNDVWQLLALAFSPTFVYLLLNHISGVNLLETAADKKWGSNSEYLAYKAQTPVLFHVPVRL